MSKNRWFDVLIAIAFLAVVGFTIRFTTAPAPVVPSSAAIDRQMTGTCLPQAGMTTINGALMTGTYLPQAAMRTANGPQMTGTYLPQAGMTTINGALMTGTYLPQAAMQLNAY
ncbi:MAG: hypothetical protein ACM3S0_11655 [Acidobacteriota bacterium]